MKYNQLLQKLLSVNLSGGMKLGLGNCLRLNAAMGFPDRSFISIHVAGTNGKGSVTKKIAKALECAGYRVGQYISPHISSFRERISVNDQMISEEAIETHLPTVFAAAEKEHITATFFEYATLLALHYFAQQKVDYAVLETGLGGRLDATNIVMPKLTIITSISLEHTEILGNDLESITREKAGIIKLNTPVIVGPRTPIDVVQEIAARHGSPCIQVKGSFPNFEEENRAIAKAALETLSIPASAIQQGLEANLPCRLEKLHDRAILDAAHNPDGLKNLFKAIRQFTAQPLRIICGLSKTKDLQMCLDIIKQHAAYIHLVEAPNGRGAPVRFLYELLIALGMNSENIIMEASISQTVQQALQEKELLIICGSFFIMSDARMALGVSEPRDPEDMNERK